MYASSVIQHQVSSLGRKQQVSCLGRRSHLRGADGLSGSIDHSRASRSGRDARSTGGSGLRAILGDVTDFSAAVASLTSYSAGRTRCGSDRTIARDVTCLTTGVALDGGVDGRCLGQAVSSQMIRETTLVAGRSTSVVACEATSEVVTGGKCATSRGAAATCLRRACCVWGWTIALVSSVSRCH